MNLLDTTFELALYTIIPTILFFMIIAGIQRYYLNQVRELVVKLELPINLSRKKRELIFLFERIIDADNPRISKNQTLLSKVKTLNKLTILVNIGYILIYSQFLTIMLYGYVLSKN